MVQYYKNLSKGWKRFLKICGVIAVLAGGIEGTYVIIEEVSARIKSATTPYIKEQVQIELEAQRANKKTSYRYKKAKLLNIPVDSILYADLFTYVTCSKIIQMDFDSIELDRKAFRVYLKTLSYYVWRELTPVEYKGVPLGQSEKSGLVFYMDDGYVFEAYYKGSTDSYWYKDAYSNESECK